MGQAEILTTVVGSYPAPTWFLAFPNRFHLRDAIMVVLKVQELAGIDVVSDGELMRFDPSHPETQGMIDYFIRPLSGVRTHFTRDDLIAFRQEARLALSSATGGRRREQIECWHFEPSRRLRFRPFPYHQTSEIHRDKPLHAFASSP